MEEIISSVGELISPNPIFVELLQNLPENHTVRKMHGLGHKDELTQADFITAAERLPREGKVIMPHERMADNWPKKSKKAINASTGAVDIYNKGE